MMLTLKMKPMAVGRWLISLALLALIGSLPAQAAPFAGGFNGTARASSMALILEQDGERVFGRIVDGRNNVFQINGQVNGTTAQGTLYNGSGTANFQLELRPSGLQFVIIPLIDGSPVLGATKQFLFERGAVTHPALADYRAPPPRSGEHMELMSFLESYRAWSPREVAIGYGGINEHDRARINKFDHVQVDVMNRLCRGGADSQDIADVSSSQQLDCIRLRAQFERADAAGSLDEFYVSVDQERNLLYTQLACERGLYPSSRCLNFDKAEKQIGHAWQDAGHIFAGLHPGKRGVAGQGAAKAAGAQIETYPPLPKERPGLSIIAATKGARVTEPDLATIGQHQSDDDRARLIEPALSQLNLSLRPSGRSFPDPGTAPSKISAPSKSSPKPANFQAASSVAKRAAAATSEEQRAKELRRRLGLGG